MLETENKKWDDQMDTLRSDYEETKQRLQEVEKQVFMKTPCEHGIYLNLPNLNSPYIAH